MNKLLEDVALAIENAHRARIGIRFLSELEENPGGGHGSHGKDKLLEQAQAAMEVVMGRLLSDEVVKTACEAGSHILNQDNLRHMKNSLTAAMEAMK